MKIKPKVAPGGMHVAGAQTKAASENVNVRTTAGQPSVILEPTVAGVVAQQPVTRNATIEYDVSGAVQVPGGKVFDAGILPAVANPALVTRTKIMAQELEKFSYPTDFSTYQLRGPLAKDLEPVTNNHITVASRKQLSRFFYNATFIMMPCGEDIVYLDNRLFQPTNVIDSTRYTDSSDAVVEAMVNAPSDRWNAKARRIAKLAKAIKLSVLAQTNDTNPFYSMRISELYDRLTDYFLVIDRAVTLTKNLRAIVNMEPALRGAGQSVYSNYKRMYTADFQAQVLDYVARLEAALVGSYYDSISLADYMRFARISLLPAQHGGIKYLVPCAHGATVAYEPYIVTSEEWGTGRAMYFAQLQPSNNASLPFDKQSILDHIQTVTNRLYSGDISMMQTGLAAFNGLPMLGELTWTGLDVGSDLVLQYMSTYQQGSGFLDTNKSWVTGPGYALKFAFVPTGVHGTYPETTENALSKPFFGPYHLVGPDGYGYPLQASTGLTMNYNGRYHVVGSYVTTEVGKAINLTPNCHVLDWRQSDLVGSTASNVMPVSLQATPVASLEDVTVASTPGMALLSPAYDGKGPKVEAADYVPGAGLGLYRFVSASPSTGTLSGVLHTGDIIVVSISGVNWAENKAEGPLPAYCTGPSSVNAFIRSELPNAASSTAWMMSSKETWTPDSHTNLNQLSCIDHAVLPVTKPCGVYAGNMVYTGDGASRPVLGVTDWAHSFPWSCPLIAHLSNSILGFDVTNNGWPWYEKDRSVFEMTLKYTHDQNSTPGCGALTALSVLPISDFEFGVERRDESGRACYAATLLLNAD